jgi:hypothetical protein
LKTHGYAASSAPFVANGALLFVLHVLVRLLLPAAVVAYAKLYWGRRALAREHSEYPCVVAHEHECVRQALLGQARLRVAAAYFPPRRAICMCADIAARRPRLDPAAAAPAARIGARYHEGVHYGYEVAAWCVAARARCRCSTRRNVLQRGARRAAHCNRAGAG